MKNMLLFTLTLAAFLPLNCPAQQSSTARIQLRIVRDGRNIRTPKKMEIQFCDKWRSVSVEKNSFLVPPDALGCPYIALKLKVGKHYLQPSGIPSNMLESEEWTILFADRAYGINYDRLLPAYEEITKQKVEVTSTCIVSFESVRSEGSSILDPVCRKTGVEKSKK